MKTGSRNENDVGFLLILAVYSADLYNTYQYYGCLGERMNLARLESKC
jgi:hypothetical protein